MNEAYKSNSGQAVDEANQDLMKFLDTGVVRKELQLEIKNHTYQQNDLKILFSISTLMQELGGMPSTIAISKKAGLSPETIYKHLHEFKNHDLNKHEVEKYQFLVKKILTIVYNLAVKGDLKACKLFLNYFPPFTGISALSKTAEPGEINTVAPGNIGHSVPIIEQNNFIQINNLKITPDELESLPTETLQQIELLIKMPIKA